MHRSTFIYDIPVLTQNCQVNGLHRIIYFFSIFSIWIWIRFRLLSVDRCYLLIKNVLHESVFTQFEYSAPMLQCWIYSNPPSTSYRIYEQYWLWIFNTRFAQIRLASSDWLFYYFFFFMLFVLFFSFPEVLNVHKFRFYYENRSCEWRKMILTFSQFSKDFSFSFRQTVFGCLETIAICSAHEIDSFRVSMKFKRDFCVSRKQLENLLLPGIKYILNYLVLSWCMTKAQKLIWILFAIAHLFVKCVQCACSVASSYIVLSYNV